MIFTKSGASRRSQASEESCLSSQGGSKGIFVVKYERLPDWFHVCGMMGHEFEEHGDAVHPPSALVFKNLRESWSMHRSPDPSRRGRRRGGMSGAGRGGCRGEPFFSGSKHKGNFTVHCNTEEGVYYIGDPTV